MGPAKLYLFLYNTAQLLGWSIILWQTVHELIITKDASSVYDRAGFAVREHSYVMLQKDIFQHN